MVLWSVVAEVKQIRNQEVRRVRWLAKPGNRSARLLEANRKSLQWRRSERLGFHVDVTNESTHLFPNRSQKPIDLGRFSLGHDFDAAIGEVSHVAGHLEAACQPAAGRSKSNPLDPTGVANTPSFEGHEIP
jgi:hypothetical protein